MICFIFINDLISALIILNKWIPEVWDIEAKYKLFRKNGTLIDQLGITDAGSTAPWKASVSVLCADQYY